MNNVDVIGVGLGYADITEKHHEIIARADVLVGGRRHLGWFAKSTAEKREITAPLDKVIDDICRWRKNRRVVVLASGDPLFYGIGETLISLLGEENINIHPNVSVMAAAFARIGRSWKDAMVVSMHGRNNAAELVKALGEKRPVFVFTDHHNTPAVIARFALDHAPDRRMYILERLGEKDEQLKEMTPEEAASGLDVASPNAVILLPGNAKLPASEKFFGNPDNAFSHDAGIITKEEIRAVSIAKLRLAPHHVLWDLGAGSGAVAIEAASLLPAGRVAAVEKNTARIKNIQDNIDRFKRQNIDIHHLNLPAGIASLPSPDRIFIGGGGKDLPEIILKAAERLAPGGRMVINAVVLETLTASLVTMKKLGFDVNVVSVQVSVGMDMSSGTRLDAKNPVFIVSAEKPADAAVVGYPDKRFPVQFVGAGPGDPELITVKGQRAIKGADLIVYAGSLVPDAVLAWADQRAELKNSAAMNLGDIVLCMVQAHISGKQVVRLHSGDPSLYGAISEQMNALEQKGVPFAVVPGVTAAFAAASALQLEYTVPEKTQTLILTRAEGRTPVPEAEHLDRLASHGAAMAIYLSAGLAEKVEKSLVTAYGIEAPVAVVSKASRPDELVIRTTAGNLSKAMADHGITSTALIIAGPALGENRGLDAVSKLYDKTFTHGCRKGIV
jgi:precorrin-6B C5,15-methyltransferase / cobalt-precorrin-6B C5,C15-methyltransferase